MKIDETASLQAVWRYVGLDTIQASEIFSNMVIKEINSSLLGEEGHEIQ
jgi:hypothetical protein